MANSKITITGTQQELERNLYDRQQREDEQYLNSQCWEPEDSVYENTWQASSTPLQIYVRRLGTQTEVYLTGQAEVSPASAGQNTIVLTLPESLRPARLMSYACPNHGNGGAADFWRVDVQTDGGILARNTGSLYQRCDFAAVRYYLNEG